ncbi:MAG: hypothetical protein JO250_05680 [Armatimonadetes bacterium]|nr:hypothetical protein [Armatimonadota bacterium]
MTRQVDFTPQTEAWINAQAQQRGLRPADLVRRVIEESAAAAPPAPPTQEVDSRQDATIALLQSWIAEDATDDPEEIRRAEAELTEFKRCMNAPRKEAGARLLFPEVE